MNISSISFISSFLRVSLAALFLSFSPVLLFAHEASEKEEDLAYPSENRPFYQLLISLKQGYFSPRNNQSVTTQQKNSLRDSRETIQQVRVTEGSESWIELDNAFMVPEIETDNTGSSYQGIRYQSVKTGYWVRAIIYGQKADIHIRSYQENLSPNDGLGIERNHFTSHMVVPLGQWIAISGKINHSESHQATYSTRSRSRDDKQTLIKVELLSPQP